MLADRKFLLFNGFSTVRWPVEFHRQVGKVGEYERHLIAVFDDPNDRDAEVGCTLVYRCLNLTTPLFDPATREQVAAILEAFNAE